MVELLGIGRHAEVACEHEQTAQTGIDVLGWLSRLFRCHSLFSLCSFLRLREHLQSFLPTPCDHEMVHGATETHAQKLD